MPSQVAGVLRATVFACLLHVSSSAHAQESPHIQRVLFHGHEASVGYMQGHAEEFGVELGSFHVDGSTANVGADLVVLMWGMRGRGGGPGGSILEGEGDRSERFLGALEELARHSPAPRIVATESAWRSLERLDADRVAALKIDVDSTIQGYLHVGVDRSNLRRLLGYLAVTYLGHEGEIESPVEAVGDVGIHHPDAERPFADIAAFKAWAATRRVDVETAPRALVLAVSHHFAVRNRDAIDRLVRRLDERGVLACVDLSPQRGGGGLETAHAFQPDVVLDARHVAPRDEDRKALDVPFLSCATLMRRTIEDWKSGPMSGRVLMGLSTAESKGSIEPRVFNGASEASGVQVFRGIDERIERIVERALAWVQLRCLPDVDKNIVFHVGSMAGGTPDNQLLNVARSVHGLLTAMSAEGFEITDLPGDPEALRAAWERRACDGSPDELARLVREGLCDLVPVEDYVRWYEARVPAAQRAILEKRRGPPPGDWFVHRDAAGKAGFVVPRLTAGRISFIASGGLPPSERDMRDVRRIMNASDPLVPSHNILAAQFHAEENLDAHARVRFGSFSLDLLLPRRVVALGEDDWPEILAGTTPDIRPFSMAATTFAIPARRRSSAVLVGHLTPPVAEGGLADELLDLQGDVVRWEGLDEGALKERFRTAITASAREQGLVDDLDFQVGKDGFTADQIRVLAAHLGRIASEHVSLGSHVLGVAPEDDALTHQLVIAAGRPFVESLGEMQGFVREDGCSHDAEALRSRAREVVELMLRRDLDEADALSAMGVAIPEGGLPEDAIEGFRVINHLRTGYRRTGDEIDHVLAALRGKFVPPGPAGSPERNPWAVPGGRNLYFFDPESLPARASWDLGVELADRFLEEWKREHDGRYPDRVAFSLSSRGSLSDHGVTESQILHLLGVKPVWRRGRVSDVELIPASELGRPRIDVFIETKHHYNDTLRSRAELLDRAVRLVCDLDEPGNEIFAGRERARRELTSNGTSPERADILSRARIFAVPMGRFGSGLHDTLFEATGVWETRGDLADVYMAQHDHVFTLGAWDEKAPLAYRTQLAGADAVLKTTSRHGALSGRSHYSGANLAAAIEHLSGERPAYYLTDVRRFGDETVEKAEDMLRRELHAILFNRRWIEGMKKEGANGAARMASLTWKVLGWKINRPESVDDRAFDRITDVYVRDAKNLRLREFFEREHPESMQEITKNLLEAARKEYWTTDRETLEEVAAVHARSVLAHGELIDDNPRLRDFVEATLRSSAAPEISAVADRYGPAAYGAGDVAKVRGAMDDQGPDPDVAPDGLPVATGEAAAADTTDADPPSPTFTPVEGRELVGPADDEKPRLPGPAWMIAIAALLLVVLGAARGKGAA